MIITFSSKKKKKRKIRKSDLDKLDTFHLSRECSSSLVLNFLFYGFFILFPFFAFRKLKFHSFKS